MARSKYPTFHISGYVLFIIFLLFVIVFLYMRQQQPQQQQQQQQQQQVIGIGESRYRMAPIPLQEINIPTRILDSFQSIGVINVEDKILPLYGRRIRDRCNYYTRTDTYNPVPIPIHFKKRDCMDDIGCEELMSGDDIKVEAMNKHGKVNIYKKMIKYI